jgi:hypothetical protein
VIEERHWKADCSRKVRVQVVAGTEIKTCELDEWHFGHSQDRCVFIEHNRAGTVLQNPGAWRTSSRALSFGMIDGDQDNVPEHEPKRWTLD